MLERQIIVSVTQKFIEESHLSISVYKPSMIFWSRELGTRSNMSTYPTHKIYFFYHLEP